MQGLSEVERMTDQQRQSLQVQLQGVDVALQRMADHEVMGSTRRMDHDEVQGLADMADQVRGVADVL
jgi:hypothetical protein